MDEKDFKKFVIPILILILAVLSFFVVKPIGTAVVLGLLFSYIFTPLYKALNKRLKSETISALIIVGGLLVIILVLLLVLMPIFIRQLFNVYIALSGADISAILFKILPGLSNSPQISTEIAAAASRFNSTLSGWMLSLFQNTLTQIPVLIFGALVLLFVFYFGLKESKSMKDYILNMIPLSKEHEIKFYEKFFQVTDSVIFGHIIIGVVQGLVAGIGYFIFGIPNALLLTVLTILFSILPIVGPWFVWMPLDFFLFVNGNDVAGMQLLIYGLFVVNWVDTIMRPSIIARRAEMNPAIALIGAIGGIYAFGIIGFVIGPLVLAYLVLLIEMYRNKQTESLVLKEIPEQKPEK